MKTTIYSKSRQLLPFLLVAFAISILASCSSSNQFASSFSKRKYTRGHFSDRVARTKTDYRPATTQTPDINTLAVTGTTSTGSNTITAQSTVKPVFKAFAKPASILFSHKTASTASVKMPKTGVQNTSISTNSSSSVENNQTYFSKSDYQGDYHHGGGDGGGHHKPHFLRLCLLFFILGLVFFIIGLASGSLGGLGFFLFISWLCFILAIIFFIIWLVSFVD